MTDKDAMWALESLTAGGSEYVDDVKRCVEAIRDRIDTNWQLAVKTKKELNTLSSLAENMATALEYEKICTQRRDEGKCDICERDKDVSLDAYRAMFPKRG